MFWLGLLRAFTSGAQTPIFPRGDDVYSVSMIELADALPLNLLGEQAWRLSL